MKAKTCEYGKSSADIVLIQPVDDNDMSVIENEVNEISRLTNRDFLLIAYQISDWNRELSPWPAPPVFGKADFGGAAGETLSEIINLCGNANKTYYIGGYSLAGLFALWAATQTDRFAGVAAASPSVWFPGFIDHLKASDIKTGKVYLSLGDKEEKSKNPVMSTVGDRIREAGEILNVKEVACNLEWNAGNHFRDSDIRTAKAFAWLM